MNIQWIFQNEIIAETVMGKLKMMTRKNYILTILTLFYCLTVLGQNGPAIIKDPDGFTNIRSGPGTDFDVVDTLLNEDFFYFKFVDNSDWVELIAWKGDQIEGFIHKSRIQEVEKIDNKNLKRLISKIINRQRTLAENFRSAWKSKDTIAYRITVRELENYNDTKYDPILQIIPKYFCSTNDDEVIEQFFDTMWADKGSASEMPSFSIGGCYICNPELIIKQVVKIKRKEKKIMILDNIKSGLMNHIAIDDNNNSKNKELNELLERLKKERKKASP